ETSIAQTVSVLVEWGLESLPVLDRDGRFAGLFGVEQALRAALERRAAAGNVRDAEQPPAVSLIMQMLLPTVPASAPLHAALAQLLVTQGRFLVVVSGWAPVGTLTDAQVAARLPDALRPLWLAALRGQGQLTQQAVESAAPGLTAADVALTPAPLVRTRETQDDAIRLALEGGHERLVAVDDEGRLAGLVTRRGLLRALAQASGS
ncbi:MAG TPA: CBS domain-containing protein, partial [Roseiflexaceae bacterium]|nr:CBS domain-containing protein [Roseiflexaceae bacterium]